LSAAQKRFCILVNPAKIKTLAVILEAHTVPELQGRIAALQRFAAWAKTREWRDATPLARMLWQKMQVDDMVRFCECSIVSMEAMMRTLRC
jgi:hypothetical protein